MITAPEVRSAETRFEAEAATISRGIVESNHTGFTGAGFVNCDNASGSSVEFTVTNDIAQDVPLTFRYANGTSAARPLQIASTGRTQVADISIGTSS